MFNSLFMLYCFYSSSSFSVIYFSVWCSLASRSLDCYLACSSSTIQDLFCSPRAELLWEEPVRKFIWEVSASENLGNAELSPLCCSAFWIIFTRSISSAFGKVEDGRSLFICPLIASFLLGIPAYPVLFKCSWNPSESIDIENLETLLLVCNPLLSSCPSSVDLSALLPLF